MTVGKGGAVYRNVAIMQGSVRILERGMRWPQLRDRERWGVFVGGALRSFHASIVDVTHG
jgi:hypothetical protein